jgi:hypothetical protein
MKHKKKTPQINYIEEVYLGKKRIESTVQESKRLQKLLGVKAHRSATHWGGIRSVDFKKANENKSTTSFIMDIDNFLLPFDL